MTIYDDEKFFNEYSKMTRSQKGLDGAGEWYAMKELFPDMTGKTVLDIGCGYGWHSVYCVEQGAEAVDAFDVSEKMIAEAKKRNSAAGINYFTADITQIDLDKKYDFVISNLVLHYIENLDDIYRKVYDSLNENGIFLFNIEHPVFTAGVNQEWIYNEDGTPSVWPVDDYYISSERDTVFLGYHIKKYHHTLTQIIMGLISAGFEIKAVVEAGPSDEAVRTNPYMKYELKRPMMLIVKAEKTTDK